MSFRFVIGRAGSGKTAFCLDEVKRRLIEDPAGPPLVVLVPEQATFQVEHALVASPELRGVMRAQALSFRRLAWRVMQETGGTARLPIDDTGKKLLLHKILHKRKRELKLFHASSEQMGFIDKLNDMFKEFKRYCIPAGELESYAAAFSATGRGTLGDKLDDLRVVYRDFEDELSKLYIDGEDCLTMLAQQLPQYAAAGETEFWIDGFNGFTPQEAAVVEQLMLAARDVTMTLCADREYAAAEKLHDLNPFHPAARTMIRMQELAQTHGIRTQTVVLDGENPARFRESPMLAHLERSLAMSAKTAYRPERADAGGRVVPFAASRRKEEQISVVAAATRRAEAEAAAREMIRLAREEGYRWRDMSVRVRNIEAYGDLLAATLSDYGIPHFFDQKRSVMHHPLAEFIRSAFETVLYNWKYDALFRCVKTDFFLPLPEEGKALGISRSDMDRLENYVLAFGLQGYKWTDGKRWEYRLFTGLEDMPVQVNNDGEERMLDKVNRCRDAIAEPLGKFQTALKRAGSVSGMMEALYELLVGLRVPERLERWSQAAIREGRPEKAKEHAQMWDRVIDMMDQLVELMGEEKVAPDTLAGLIDTGLESIRLGLVPPSVDQVLVGSIDRTRSAQVKRLFVLGVTEGVLPSKMKEDGILTEAERERLSSTGLTLAEDSRRKLLDEQFLIYCALCSPSEHLWLSYPLADEEGKTLLPSDTIRQVKRLFPSMKEREAAGEPAVGEEGDEPARYIEHPDRTLSYLTVQLKHAMRGGSMSGLWWDVYNWYAFRPEWSGKLHGMMKALDYTNAERTLRPDTSVALYGDRLKSSVSRMERFVACPFSHFASHGLRLSERRMYRLEAPDIGQLFHAALSRFAERATQEGIDWGALTEEACAERASAVVQELAPKLQSEILLSSQRYHYISRKLTATVAKAAAVLGEHARQASFEPVGLELGFGPGQTLPSLRYKLDGGRTMEVIGRIDRVDRAETGKGTMLRIIDYKSSQTTLNLAEVYYGLSLQMLTYLDVVLTFSGKWLGNEASPAGVLYFHVHNPIVYKKRPLEAKQAESERMKQYKMKGLVLADEETVKLMDAGIEGRNGHSPLIPVALNKNREFYSSSVATETEWATLRTYVRRTIRRIGSSIANGSVAIAPYRMGQKQACRHCSYKSVCQFDPLIEGSAYQTLPAYGKERVWQLMEQDIRSELPDSTAFVEPGDWTESRDGMNDGEKESAQ